MRRRSRAKIPRLGNTRAPPHVNTQINCHCTRRPTKGLHNWRGSNSAAGNPSVRVNWAWPPSWPFPFGMPPNGPRGIRHSRHLPAASRSKGSRPRGWVVPDRHARVISILRCLHGQRNRQDALLVGRQARGRPLRVSRIRGHCHRSSGRSKLSLLG